MEHCATNEWHSKYGAPWPLGVQYIAEEDALNFAIYSKHATRIELVLFGDKDFELPVATFPMHPLHHKSGPVWHLRLRRSDTSAAQYYAYRVDGPPPTGGFDVHCFDEQKLLLDPYVRDIYFPPRFDRAAAIMPGDNIGRAPLGILPTAQDQFHWGPETCIRHGHDLIIYELHIRGFTRHSSSNVAEDRRGTFMGVVDKIPYLKDLGITAVELMPVFQYDPQEGNYWGYMPLSFFAPHEAYASQAAGTDQHNEFRYMVRELHRAGIEVILDVVYNHTCEGNEDGPNYCFKGIDSSTYYVMLDSEGSSFANFSGTGNTIHTANRAARQLIVDSLRYWVKEMHVDGFRFDLASIFTRDSTGAINLADPPIFGQIAADPHLAGIRLIAEPWDIGAYQLGRGFPGNQWLQWNSAYQKCIQGFVRGDLGLVPELMTRIHGSSDLFPDDCFHSLRPFQSINYVTCHDSFTLYDLVSYDAHHNEANGLHNTDGHQDLSWNCGVEGDRDVTAEIAELRVRQAKNFFLLLMLSAGTPMFRMGDEFLQTQSGNNNPYNQDNETSWLNWDRAERFADFHRFCKKTIALRKRHCSFSRQTFWHDAIRWYGTTRNTDLSPTSRTLAYCLHGVDDDPYDFYVLINADQQQHDFGIHERTAEQWRPIINTALADPQDCVDWSESSPISENLLAIQARSIVVLQAAMKKP